MFEVRIHGRGGQGAVTAAEMLAVAAFFEGRYAQAFPTFGSERTGAPVVSFCRVDDEPIRSHDPISRPDALIVLDVTLIHQVHLFDGITPATFLLLNTSRSPADLGLDGVFDGLLAERTRCVPATELARSILGRPLPNTALLGAFARLTGVVSLDSVVAAIRSTFATPLDEANARVAELAYGEARNQDRSSHA